MTPMTMVFGREKSFRLGESSFPIHEDFSLGLKNRTKYTYDVFNRLVGKTVSDKNGEDEIDSRAAYVYDGDNMVLEFQNASSDALTNSDLVRRFLDGSAVDQVFAEEVTSGGSSVQTRWLLTDNEGTIRNVATYAAGVTTVQDHLVYDSFGNVVHQSNSAYTPTFTYTGQVYDADAQAYHCGVRWYDPQTGQFLSHDPLGFAAGDPNLYRYCGNGPTNFTDPSGMYEYQSGGGGSGGAGGGWSGPWDNSNTYLCGWALITPVYDDPNLAGTPYIPVPFPHNPKTPPQGHTAQTQPGGTPQGPVTEPLPAGGTVIPPNGGTKVPIEPGTFIADQDGSGGWYYPGGGTITLPPGTTTLGPNGKIPPGSTITYDPIGYSGGINLYEYVGDNPEDRTDPSGEKLRIVGNPACIASITAILKQLCPTGLISVGKNGVVSAAQGPCEPGYVEACKCVHSLIANGLDNTIECTDFTPVTLPGNDQWDSTKPTPGRVQFNPSLCAEEWRNGQWQRLPQWVVLGHELCGHAWNYNRCVPANNSEGPARAEECILRKERGCPPRVPGDENIRFVPCTPPGKKKNGVGVD